MKTPRYLIALAYVAMIMSLVSFLVAILHGALHLI